MARQYKLVVVGDGGVGKTAFARRQNTGNFVINHVVTVDRKVHGRTFCYTSEGTIVFEVWVAGEDQKDCRGAYDGADCAIVLFDVTSRNSFENVGMWVRDIRSHTGPDTPIMLCGNKVDLDRKDRVVWGRDVADVLGPLESDFHAYRSISVKTNHNVDKLYLNLAQILTGVADLTFEEGQCKPISADGLKTLIKN